MLYYCGKNPMLLWGPCENMWHDIVLQVQAQNENCTVLPLLREVKFLICSVFKQTKPKKKNNNFKLSKKLNIIMWAFKLI